MLGTPRACENGPAFAVGWLAGLTIVGTIMLVIASGNATESSGEPATWTSVLKLVFGVLFLLLAVHSWPAERRARGADAEVDAGGRHLQRRQGAWAGRFSRGSTRRTSH